MSEVGAMDCKIYVDTPIARDELARVFRSILGTADESASVITVEDAEIEIRLNPDFDERQRLDFPDGFLRFRYVAEVYRRDAHDGSPRAVVSRLLAGLWAIRVASVAACDYEGDLPEKGGYRSRVVPWPDS